MPNHLTEQWASEFLRLYPSANILVATKKDFETRNRKKFCSRIATGDYDAVIIGHSQFERIPISAERQERLLYEQIEEIEDGLAELKASNAERFTIKQLEKTRKSLEARLDKLHNGERKDDVVTFEQLGVDRLFVDEAHSYKNLFLYTKMRNVAGISTTEAQKSSDMLLKCRYLDELTGGKGVVFATGTPVSNSMTELYTMMRYLQHDMLQRNHLTHFDNWASIFGETTTAIELAPEGTGYRARTHFAKFFNLPELMTIWKEAADIKTADQLNLPTPEVVYHNEVAHPTPQQQETALSYAEIKALCAGDPRIKEKMDLDIDVARLKLLKANHQSQQYRLEDDLLTYFPEQIEQNKGFIAGLEKDMVTLSEHQPPEGEFAGMVIRDDTLTDKDNAGAAILEACKEVKTSEPVEIGTYRGFTMSIALEGFQHRLTLKEAMTHRVELGGDARGNLTRIENTLAQMPERLENEKNQLENLHRQQDAARAELGKPFPQEAELQRKSARLAELNALLDMESGRPAAQTARQQPAKAERPSVLEGLKAPGRPGPGAPKKQKSEREAR